jgi:hypothetical protein
MIHRIVIAASTLALLSACAGGAGPEGFGFGYYGLVQPGPEKVASNELRVAPTIAWNKTPRTGYDISREENWTLNGPLLDNLTFIGGVRSGKAIVRQRRRAERQVPRFRADMSPPEIASMIETFYRIRGGAVNFEITSLQPRPFLGQSGFQLDYRHLDSDEVQRQGRAVGAVIGDRLYLILFDAVRSHYFPAALPEVERIISSARLRG